MEASPIDTIWGIGLSEKDRRAWNRETWRGKKFPWRDFDQSKGQTVGTGTSSRTCDNSKAEKGLEQQSD